MISETSIAMGLKTSIGIALETGQQPLEYSGSIVISLCVKNRPCVF